MNENGEHVTNGNPEEASTGGGGDTPTSVFRVVASALDGSKFDWFLETTVSHPNNTLTVVTKNAIIIAYDENGNPSDISGQRSTTTDEYGNPPKVVDSGLNTSQLMRDAINISTEYHHVSSGKPVWKKFVNFISEKKDDDKHKNRISAGSTGKSR